MKKTSLLHSFATVALLYTNVAVLAQNYPHTDPTNSQSWVLVNTMSDEFDGAVVDEVKWQICGRNGIYWGQSGDRPGFTGRGYPATGDDTGWEFSPNNVRVHDGKLKIATKYEPDYPWVNNPDNYNFEFTTGGVWSKQTFTYGYMEIRCRAADTAATAAFWTTGAGAELDVFEAIGKHSTRTNLMWSSVHDWTFPTEPNNAWTSLPNETSLPFGFADGFITYAAEWDEDGIEIWADGVSIYRVTKAEVESGTFLNGSNITSTNWPLNGGQHVWADSEIFPWWDVPNPANLLSANNSQNEYEVEYIRVWQKSPNAAPAFSSDPVVKNTATEGVPITGSLSGDATDADSDPITFTKLSGPGWLSVAANGALSGTPSVGNVDTNVFTIKATALGGSDVATLNVVVNPGPWNEFITSNGLTGVKNNDKDADTWSDWSEYIFGGAPDDATVIGVEPSLDATTAKYSFQLRNDSALTAHVMTNTTLDGSIAWTHHETINVAVNDGMIETYESDIPASLDQLFVVLEVEDTSPVNQPPAFTSNPLDQPNAKATDPYDGSIASDASDPEGDPITFSKTAGPAWLTVADNGELSGTPSNDDSGDNLFSILVSALGGVDTATMNVTVDADWTVINSEGFESGFGIWNDEGNDSRRFNNASFAHSGSYSVEIRDDEPHSYITTDNINLSSYTELRIEFFFVSEHLSNGEGFDLQVRDHNTQVFTTVASYRHGTDFSNNVRDGKTAIVTISDVNFGSTNQIRFESESNLNLDHVYLDDITISAR